MLAAVAHGPALPQLADQADRLLEHLQPYVGLGPDAAEDVLWPNSGLPGELSQVLPTPRHFEQASSLVTEEMIGESTVCGNDVDQHVQAVQEYVDAGYDEVYQTNGLWPCSSFHGW